MTESFFPLHVEVHLIHFLRIGYANIVESSEGHFNVSLVRKFPCTFDVDLIAKPMICNLFKLPSKNGYQLVFLCLCQLELPKRAKGIQVLLGVICLQICRSFCLEGLTGVL